jgi:chemotaxis protein MotB
LQEDKKTALKQVENLTVLTQSSSEGINNVIAQLSEKDK